jgi:Acyl-CoA thioester hydrolase/BAAT N-terminal region
MLPWRAVCVGVAVAGLAAGCGGNRADLELNVTPSSALLETPFHVQVNRLRARERVTISVFGVSRRGEAWRAVLVAQADPRGQVDLRKQYLIARLRPLQEPAAGDYLPWQQDDLRVLVRSHEGTATLPERKTTGDSLYGALHFGGSPQADEAAREDSWPRLLRFLATLAKS